MTGLTDQRAVIVLSDALENLSRCYTRWFRLRWDHAQLASHLHHELSRSGYELVSKHKEELVLIQEPVAPTGQIVRVGQIWADNDWRSHGRHVQIVEVGRKRVTVEVVTERGGEKAKTPRRTKIMISRLRPNSTGYRLVSDAPTC